MSRYSRFTRGAGCYKCKMCGRRTRETGGGESDVELCAGCYQDAGYENAHADGHHVDHFVEECPACRAEGKR